MDRFRDVETEPPPVEPFPPPPGVPASMIPRGSNASTEPAPNEVAAAILAELKPSIENIFGKLEQLFEKMRAIDNGVGSALTQVGLLETAIGNLGGITENLANAVMALSQEQVELRTAMGDQSTFDKGRLATDELLLDETRQLVEVHETRIERLEVAAEG